MGLDGSRPDLAVQCSSTKVVSTLSKAARTAEPKRDIVAKRNQARQKIKAKHKQDKVPAMLGDGPLNDRYLSTYLGRDQR